MILEPFLLASHLTFAGGIVSPRGRAKFFESTRQVVFVGVPRRRRWQTEVNGALAARNHGVVASIRFILSLLVRYQAESRRVFWRSLAHESVLVPFNSFIGVIFHSFRRRKLNTSAL